MDQVVVAIHFAVIGSEEDESPIQFTAIFDLLEDLADLIVDQRHFSGVTGAQLPRVVDLLLRLGESAIEFPGRTSASKRRAFARHRHFIRAIHTRIRLGRVPRFVGSGKTDPTKPWLRTFVIAKVIFGLLPDVNIVVLRQRKRRRPNQRFIFASSFLNVFLKSFEQA